ncbi:predicted protein [Nematostella vectensis]|uniref:Glyoxylate reductase/hydroxypyruvate reductase n=1 Tax=Nematostella vectensis TaxID=45351 RepID=A7RL06_NEMVE|nr:predicted protein [Nematostella vectensis]|eukprot:XP_001639916.1 predicted protein [Nematostella vectensis]
MSGILRPLVFRQNIRCLGTQELSKVLVTRRVPQLAMDILKTSQSCDLDVWDSDDPIPRAELLKRAQGKDGLYVLLTEKVDAELLDAAGPQLRVVSTMSVGYDHVTTKELKNRNIPLGYTPNVLTDATATLTVALLLATSRRLIEAVGEVKNGGWSTWKPMWMCGATLRGSTVGIVGLGRIGLAVAQRLLPFGVSKIVYSGWKATPEVEKQVNATHVDNDALFAKSDFVLGCTALTSETQGMFNKDAFSKMKSTAIFVNTSRGGVVNQDDLYDALKDNAIRAAGLDVTVPEPLPTDHKLLSLPNCVILPHIGSAEDATRTEMATLAARNLLAGLRGEKMPAQADL